MKTLLLLSTLLLALTAVGRAAPPDSSLATRNMAQQMFASEYMETHMPEGGVTTEAELIHFLDGFAEAWKAKVEGESATYKRVNSYVPMWMIRYIVAKPEPSWARCVGWQRYAAPAFVADTEDLKQNGPSLETSFLIRAPNVDWAAFPSAFCELPLDEWKSINAALRAYPDLIDRALDAQAYRDEKHRKSLQRIQRLAAQYTPILDINEALYGNNYDGAFAMLAAEFGKGDNRALLAPLGGRLAQRYRDAGSPYRALAVLDLVTRSTSKKTIARDTLRAWYQKVDPEQGPARFLALVEQAASASLVPGNESYDLRGTFDMLNGETVALESFQGRLVLLDFWSVGCGPCLEEVPTLNALHEQYGDRFVLLSINNDLGYGATVEAVRAVAEEYDMRYRLVLDTPELTLMKQFGVGGWPAYLLLDEQGKILVEPTEQRRELSLDEVKAFLAARG